MPFPHAGLYSGVAVNNAGVPIASATVNVYLQGTTTNAALFVDRTQVAGAANPVTADVLGNFAFYAVPGLYDVKCNGVTVTVEVTVDPADVAGPPGVVPATRIVGFGHSWLAGFGTSSSDRGFGEMISASSGAAFENFSVAGAELGHDNVGGGTSLSNNPGNFGVVSILQEPSCISLRTSAPRVPSGYIGFLLYGINDLGAHHGDQGNNPRTVWKHALRTAISRLSASQIFEDTSATVAYGGGTWQPVVASRLMNSGAGYRAFPANAATFTITVPADFEGGAIAVGFVAYPGSDATVTWSGTASAATGTTNLTGAAYNPGGSAQSLQRSSNNCIVQRFNLLATDAGKTLIGTISGMGAQVAAAGAPGTITQGGAAGAASYGYQWIAGNQNGDGIPSTTTTTATGNATLNGTNFNTIPSPGAFPTGATYMKLRRVSGGASQGIIATLTTPAAVNDIGVAAAVYVANTGNPQINGGAFDYWQAESVNPTTANLVANICRCLPGALPLQGVNQDGGYQGGFGYTTSTYQNSGSTAITAGGTVGATTITVNYAGLTAAQQAKLVAGGVVNLTGGTAEAFYISSINTGTGVITLSNSPTVAQGFVRNAGHTAVTFGWPNDADVLAWNSDMSSVCAEFSSTVQYCDIDAQISLNVLHYYLDGLHLNDRGCAIGAGVVATALGLFTRSLQPYQLASLGRGPRRPENISIKQYNAFSAYGVSSTLVDLNLTATVWTDVVDSAGNPVQVVIAAKPGDVLEIACSGLWGNQVPVTLMDVATMNGNTPISYCGINGPAFAGQLGVGTWAGLASVQSPINGAIFYTVQPADVIGGNGSLVFLRLRYAATTAAGKTLYMVTYPFMFSAKNIGVPAYSYGQ